MKQKIMKIEPIGAFAIDPNQPEEMNEKFPFMHNFFVEPNVLFLKELKSLFIFGLSDHVDENLQNPVCYAGLLSKSIFPELDWRNIDHVYMISFVKNGVPEPEGAIEYLYKGKTIRFPGRSGKYYYQKNIDVSMMYIDRFMKPSKDTDPELCEMIAMMHREEDKQRQRHAYENQDKLEEEYQQNKLDFWQNFVQG